MDGIFFRENFLPNPDDLFNYLIAHVSWDESMRARKTASFGKPYNYSQITYQEQAFIKPLEEILPLIEEALGFQPNNCLLNYYLDGKAKMGFHSDQTDILAQGTGVVIISLGETRNLRFRQIADKAVTKDYALTAGSLIYMSQAIQDEWQHAIPPNATKEGRISLTFRKLS